MIFSSVPRAAACLLALSLSCPAASKADDADIRAAVDRMMPTLVRIHVVMEQGSEGRMKKNQGSGSGAIISPEGYVLTNHHVAGHGTRFVCTLSNREEVDATLVGTDALSDLAVIKLDLSTRRDPSQPLAVATFGDSDRLKVGDVVLAMGCPGGLSQSVTRGIVANTEMIVPRHQISMTLDGEKVGELVRWIGHDAVIYPGNSGGPLVNLEGEIVGVNEVGIASLGGAIPANLAKKVAAGLIEKGRIIRSWIGLEPQTLLRSMSKAKGLLVADVWPESPAGKAAIRSGDFITHYNGQIIPDCHAPEDLPLFHAMVLGTAPGTKVTLKGERDGKPIEWQLVTEEREPNLARESESREWGLTLRNLTKVSALELRRKNTRGVLVDSVKTGGPSNQGKPPLRPEDVILKLGGTEIADLDAFKKFTTEFTAGLTKPKPLLVEFARGTESLVTVIDVGPEEDPSRPQTADKPWLGATSQVLTDDLTEALQIKGKRGVRITSVIPSSPAGRAGLQTGDLLFKLDGRVINARRPEDSGVLPELIRAYPVDAKVSFEIQRGSESKTVEVQLEPSPASDQQPRDFVDDRFEFTVTEPSEHQRSLAALTGAKSGLTVAKVETAGWAALGGLVAGDVLLEVNGAEVTSLDGLKQTLQSLRESKPRSVIFFVQRGPRSVYLEIEPRW
ncbi:MAG TPA: PDZ domain-containing protein [Luteolibacter sp.]|nr:PDZ domain-containing protein [Luteolibacter sp.]